MSGPILVTGAARISADTRRLLHGQSDYRGRSAYCIQHRSESDKELWQTGQQTDLNVAAMSLALDGRVLASASVWDDPAIRVWNAKTRRLVARLDGHTASMKTSMPGATTLSAF